jgi:phosphoribosylpyrophosphate synthetase
MPLEIPQEETVMIAVDEGARERVQMAKEHLENFNDIVQILKERTESGIKSTINDESLGALKKAKIGIIVDDICDSGMTFLKSADIIRKVNPDIELILIITHGIFSAGLEGLRGQFDSLMVLETDYNYVRLSECH